MDLKRLPWKAILSWLLAAFFLVGSIGNAFPPDNILADYERWGYPGWFHWVTAFLEFATALLLLRPKTRLAGCLLGSLVITAAAVTVLFNGEYTHALAPLLVLFLLILNSRLNRP